MRRDHTLVKDVLDGNIAEFAWYCDVGLALWAASSNIAPSGRKNVLLILQKEGQRAETHQMLHCLQTALSLLTSAALLYYKGSMDAILESLSAALFLINWWLAAYQQQWPAFKTPECEVSGGLEGIASRLYKSQMTILQYIANLPDVMKSGMIRHLRHLVQCCIRVKEKTVGNMLEEQCSILL